MLKRYYLSTAILATALIGFDAHAMWQSDDKDANNSLSPIKSPVEKKTVVTSAKEKTARVSSKPIANQLKDSSLPETSNVEKKTTPNPIDSIDEDEEYVKNLLSKLELMKKDKKKHPNDRSTRFTKKGDSLLIQPYTEPSELSDIFSRNTDAKSLNVYKTYFNDGLIEDLSKSCKSLTALDASFTSISDAGVKVLSQSFKGQLKSLVLSANHLSNLSLKYLGEDCKSLTHVYLDDVLDITDDGIAVLCQGCPDLEVLSLGRNFAGAPYFTDVTLDSLSKSCPQIRSLNMKNSMITPNGLKGLLLGCKNIGYINVQGCKIPNEFIIELKTAYPNLVIDNKFKPEAPKSKKYNKGKTTNKNEKKKNGNTKKKDNRK